MKTQCSGENLRLARIVSRSSGLGGAKRRISQPTPVLANIRTSARGAAARRMSRFSALRTNTVLKWRIAQTVAIRISALRHPWKLGNDRPWKVASEVGQREFLAMAVVKIAASKWACTMSGFNSSTSAASRRAARKCPMGFMPRAKSMAWMVNPLCSGTELATDTLAFGSQI